MPCHFEQHSQSSSQGGEQLLRFKSAYFTLTYFCMVSTGSLNCCKVSSRTHLPVLSHWVQAGFVTSAQQDFSLAWVFTQPLVWLAARTTNQFSYAKGSS